MMEKIEKRILVNAPTPQIFSFINEPFNLLRIWPGMIEVTDVRHLSNGGRNFRCVSKMADSRIQYANECIEYVANRCITYKISGGMRGSIRWLFEVENEYTQVTLLLEYDAPLPLLKRHTNEEINKRNEHSLQQALCNLKTVIERQVLVRE